MNKKVVPQWFVLTILWLAGNVSAAPTNSAPAEPFDYAQPAVLTGTIYATGSDHKRILFTFRRMATRSGSTVHVERTFTLPDGKVAATETIQYNSGQLVSDETLELQTSMHGDIDIQSDPKNPAHQTITISHGPGIDTKSAPKKPGTTDDLPKDALTNDSIYPFILAHWDELMKGGAIKFRYPSLEWEKTFGFKLSKTGESTLNGVPVVILRMEATSLIVSTFMDALTFTVEKNSPHRVLEYLGRTTPKIKIGKAWKPLDADTVFDWK